MRCPEDDLLKGLVGHWPRRCLEAEGVKHVADAGGDDSVCSSASVLTPLIPSCVAVVRALPSLSNRR
jgi:hypothetical protein